MITVKDRKEVEKMLLKATYHSGIERQDRIVEIATTVGFGEVVVKKFQEQANNYKSLTSTGVIIVTDPKDDKKVITMFVATLAQAKSFYTDGALPNWLYKVVKSNIKHNRINYKKG